MNDDLELRIVMIIGLLVGCILGGLFILKTYEDWFPKYCPECGSNYRSSYEYCSADGTLLKDRGEE
jgi:hypothetical protein